MPAGKAKPCQEVTTKSSIGRLSSFSFSPTSCCQPLALSDGAWGVSAGLDYKPGYFATTVWLPIASAEGYIRQVIGWREYMRGMYRAHPELEHANALELDRELEHWWYTLDDVPLTLPEPVRVVLQRVHALAYAHHIERLMVLGSWMLMQGYAPRSVNRWFLSLFVDAYPWVMVANVMGMSQFADGGLVGTKPYVSGGAYLQRMGRWWSSDRAARESAFTDAYWAFLERHEDMLAGNHRLAQPLAQMRQRRAERG